MSDAIISIIAAIAQNNVIGSNGDMPWRLSSDLKRFKRDTMSSAIIMGRKTFDSIGKPLPGRANIVVTRQKNFSAPGIDVAASLEEAIKLAEIRGRCLRPTGQSAKVGARESFIIGGGELYRQAIEIADRLYITHVEANPDGDTFFPEFSSDDWREVKSESFPAGENDSAPTRYAVYERI